MTTADIQDFASRLNTWSKDSKTLLISALLEDTNSARAIAEAINLESEDSKEWLHSRVDWPDV